MKLRWRKNPKETGLMRVGANPNRGSGLFDENDNEYAYVNPKGGAWNIGPFKGWYWGCYSNKEYDIPWTNTCNDILYQTDKEAKDAAKAFVMQYINQKNGSRK